MGIRFGPIELDEKRYQLWRDGVRLQVRPKVFDLLVHLIRHRERVVLRDELVMTLWGTTAVGLGSLSGLVNELRQLLGEAGRGPSSIRTVHARGYQFVAEIEAPETETPRRSLDGVGTWKQGQGETALATDPEQFGAVRGMIRTSFSRVSRFGARAVIVVGTGGSGRSSLLDQASSELSTAAFEIHRLRIATSDEGRSTEFVVRLIETLAERHGADALHSMIPERAHELLERVGATLAMSKARPRDPLASRQVDERIWRSAAELLREFARKSPLAFVIDERDDDVRTASRNLTPLLRLLGKARVFVLCAARVSETPGVDDGSAFGVAPDAETRIEYARLPTLNRGRLNELLEARGVAALPVTLTDALVAHVRDDTTSLESIAAWLEAEGGAAALVRSDAPVVPDIQRRIRRVEPNTNSCRKRVGSK